MWWINRNGFVYQGDCIQGDREATEQELEAWNLSRIQKVTRINAGQFMQQLIIDGKDAIAEMVINAIPDVLERKRVIARYNRESFFVITDPDLQMLAGAVGYDTQDKIQLFFDKASLL